MDTIDAFCDYWEACEFLSPKQRPFVGGKAEIISKRLAKYLIPDAHDTRLSKVSTKICAEIVRPMYNLRIDLVHNLGEDSANLNLNVPIVGEIAHHLLQAWLGIDFSPTKNLEKLGFSKQGFALTK